MQLAHQDVERLGHAGFDARLALHDRFIDLGAPVNVVGFRCQQLLQDVRGSVGLQRPHFHFAESLAAELRFAPQGLLRDQRVRTNRTRVDLVIHQVGQLQHVNVADGDVLRELVSGHSVEQRHLAGVRQPRHLEQVADLGLPRPVEHRRGEWDALAEAFGQFEKPVVL